MRGLIYSETNDFGDLLVMMPAGERLPDPIMDCVRAFLARCFPELKIQTLQGEADKEYDFMVILMAGLISGSDEVTDIESPPVEKLNKIVDALHAFHASGWHVN